MMHLSHTQRDTASAIMAVFLVLTTVIAVAPANSRANTDELPPIEINAAEAADPTSRDDVAPSMIFSPENIGNNNAPGLSPMMQDIQAVVEQSRTQAQELESRVALASDEESILAIQREIEELAQETELEILRVQVRHARLDGREELATKIEQDIADIQNPPVVRVQIYRPERPEPNHQ